MIHVLIVGEAGLLRGALVAVLSAEVDIEVVAEVEKSGIDQIRAIKPKPDVIIIDTNISDGDPLQLIQEIAGQVPRCGVIVLTTHRTPAVLRRALAADVRGFLSKDLDPTELIRMIRQVHAGERVIDPVVALAALNMVTNPLTHREQEILRATAEGMSTKEISQRLFLTHGTVRNHLSAIMRKTASRSRWEAVRRAQDAGWL